MNRELNLYPLSAAGKNIERAFLEDEFYNFDFKRI